MDLAGQGTKGNTQLVVDKSVTSSLHYDDSKVRSNEVGMLTHPRHLSGGKSLHVSCAEARVVAPRDDEEMQKLQMDFANLNPKSPPNLDVHTGNMGPFPVQDQMDGKPRSMPPMMKAGSRLDARCDPRAIPQTTTKACHPTDSHASAMTAQPSDTYPRGLGAYGNTLPSQVEVVPTQTDKQRLYAQIQQLAANQTDEWKKDLIQKLLKLHQKTKGCVPVAPDNDLENNLDKQKEKQFHVQVVENKVEEPMTITISDSDDEFCDIRTDTKPSHNNIQPQEDLKTLSQQPTDTTETQLSRLALPNGHLNGNNYNRKYEFLKGHILPGSKQSLTHLLMMYSAEPSELAIGCHGILTSNHNRATEFGEYEEVEEPSKGHQFIKTVGRGSYGCVKLCRDNSTKKEFVKKEVFKVDNLLLFEVRILSELTHINIAGLYGFILRDGKPEILLEYAGVSLLEYTSLPDNPEDTSEEKIIEMAYQGLSALEYLDMKGIIHYDIKPENICILKTQIGIVLKITDFGSAKKVTDPPDFLGCTVEYLSPELGIQLVNSKYQNKSIIQLGLDVADYPMTTKSDIYAFALTLMFVYRKGHVVISLFNAGNMTYNGLDQVTINRMRQTILVSIETTVLYEVQYGTKKEVATAIVIGAGTEADMQQLKTDRETSPSTNSPLSQRLETSPPTPPGSSSPRSPTPPPRSPTPPPRAPTPQPSASSSSTETAVLDTSLPVLSRKPKRKRTSANTTVAKKQPKLKPKANVLSRGAPPCTPPTTIRPRHTATPLRPATTPRPTTTTPGPTATSHRSTATTPHRSNTTTPGPATTPRPRSTTQVHVSSPPATPTVHDRTLFADDSKIFHYFDIIIKGLSKLTEKVHAMDGRVRVLEAKHDLLHDDFNRRSNVTETSQRQQSNNNTPAAIQQIPDELTIPADRLRSLKERSASAGNFASLVVKELLPHLFGPDNLRQLYNWNGGGVNGKRELSPRVKGAVKTYTVHFYPECQKEDIFRDMVIQKVNEHLRRPTVKACRRRLLA